MTIFTLHDGSREHFFPKPLHEWPQSTGRPAVEMGWTAKGYIRGGVGASVSKRFDNEQKQFLHSIFDTHKRTGVKVHEQAAHEMMVKHFNQTGEGQALSKRKVLRVAQIKSWLSQENA